MEKERTKKRKADFDTIQIENDSTCIWLIVPGIKRPSRCRYEYSYRTLLSVTRTRKSKTTVGGIQRDISSLTFT